MTDRRVNRFVQVNECLDLLVREARKKDNRLERRTVIVRWQDRVQVVGRCSHLHVSCEYMNIRQRFIGID